jgi:uncharacterized membrane protein YkvI
VRKKYTAKQVAAAYIGTIVGAGFASGQEVIQFFGSFGLWGIAGIIFSALLFVYFGKVILHLGKELEADSHQAVIRHACGNKLGTFLDYLIIFFLFGALTAMVAGSGALFREQFNLPPLLGNVVMVTGTALTVLAGLGGVIAAISFFVPVLFVAIFSLAVYTFLSPGTGGLAGAAIAGSPAVPFWPLAALVYVSFNLVMAVAVLAPLGRAVEDKRSLEKGAFWGGIGLGAGALAILLTILLTAPASSRYSIPLIYIAGRLSPLAQLGYSIVLLAEVYTTAVASYYGFVVRLVPEDTRKRTLAIAGTGIGSFLASQAGFVALVRFLYPAVGYAGLALLGGLLVRRVPGFLKLAPQFRPRKRK